jgi:DNA-binding transcriptional MocR family regulator
MNWLDKLKSISRHKDRRSPIYARLAAAVADAIEDGSLAEGERLPADRELAQLLEIDRSTVARTYDELEKNGLVYSHVGRGTFVLAASARAGASRKTVTAYDGAADQIFWPDKFSRHSQHVASIVGRQPAAAAQTPELISFAGGTPSQEFFPQDQFSDILSSLVSSGRGAEMFGYSQAEGLPQLREQVRLYLKKQGIVASDDQLLILSGSQQGIDLVCRTLADPGDAILIESPTYFWALCNFAAAGARLVPVDMDDNGLRVDLLEGLMQRQRAKLLYLMPSFQNPTGTTMPVERRKQVLELASYYQVPILEDNFVGDLSYEGQVPPTLRSLDTTGNTVIYQGTFSKALCPGLRLGWLVAPAEVISRLISAKRACDLSTNSMAQLFLAEYLKNGLYERHLDHVRSAYRRRRDVLCQALQKHLGGSVSWHKPAGGMFLWAKLPAGYSGRELLPFAEREAVTFSPGDTFFAGAGNPEFIRLTFIQQPEAQIEEGIARLARAIKAYGNSRKRAARAGADRLEEATFI